MIKHTAEKYAAIFQQTDGDPRAVQNGVNGYRVKTIRAGDTLEIEGYAIWSTQRTAAEARKQTERHREQVRAVHLRNRQKAMRRLINANFGDGDILLTLTYGWGSQPQDEKQAGRDVKNFLKRLRRKRARLGLEDLKYIYTTEVTHGTAVRYHHHLIVNGGIPREEIEALWTSGLINSRIARTDTTGLAGWAHYMVKQKATQEKASRRGFTCSRNLKKPGVTTADHKLSVRRMKQMAEDFDRRGAEILEALYPGYVVIERPEIKWSAWVGGVYLSARMVRESEYFRLLNKANHNKPQKGAAVVLST